MVSANDDREDFNLESGNGLSIREALWLAKLHDGADTITFAQNLANETITMETGKELTVNSDVMIINNTNASIIIDAVNESRIFNVAKGATVGITNVILTNGYSKSEGGAIYSKGALTLNKVVISDSFAETYGGGLYQYAGSATLVDCQVNNNEASIGAGVVYVNAYGTLIDTVIEGNVASNQGGGLYQDRGKVTVTGGTIKGNEATSGAGFAQAVNSSTTFTGTEFTNNKASAQGGAIYSSSLLTLVDVDINNCSATLQGGGVYHKDVTLGVNCSIIISESIFTDNEADNGAGVFLLGAIKATITNTDFDGNIAVTNGGALYQDGGKLIVSGGLIENNEAKSGAGFYQNVGGTADFTGTVFDFNVASLTGGGIYSKATLTLDNVVISNSSAVSYGGGLYQYAGSATLVDCLISGNKAYYGAGITFENAYGTLTDTIIEGNIASTGGGVFQNRGKVTVNGGVFEGNEAKIGAGFVQAVNSSTTFTGTEFTNNNASSQGGAIYSSSLLTLVDVDINNCSATLQGGGVYHRDVTLGANCFIIINDSTFADNKAGSGAGLFLLNALGATITNTAFDGNIADTDGGALYQDGGKLVVSGGRIENSKAELAFGGGIYSNSNLSLANVVVAGCIAGTRGGGVYHKTGTLTIQGGKFENNEATNWGGGLWTSAANGIVAISGVDFISNTAGGGAGIYNSASQMTITGGAFENNNTLKGGALYQDRDGKTTIDGTAFTGNATGNKGGAIYNFGDLVLKNFEDKFSGNTAVDEGDAIAIMMATGKLSLPETDIVDYEALTENIFFDDLDIANW